MTDFQNLMIDLECMGTEEDAALCSIGAVFFDYNAGTLGPTFEQTIHLATSVRDGGVIEPGAVLWWLGQSQPARDSIRFGGRDHRVVLQEFSNFIGEHCRHEDVIPWGNSNAFDLTKLSRAYRRVGIEIPWYWSRERDFRTIRNWYKARVDYTPDDKGDGAHNALADAIYQAEHMIAIKRSFQK